MQEVFVGRGNRKGRAPLSSIEKKTMNWLLLLLLCDGSGMLAEMRQSREMKLGWSNAALASKGDILHYALHLSRFIGVGRFMIDVRIVIEIVSSTKVGFGFAARWGIIVE